MHVGDDDAEHGQAVQHVLEDLFPSLFDFVAADAAVDDGPAFLAIDFVAQEPKIDVVERERKRHAYPTYAVRYGYCVAGGGDLVSEGIRQLHFIGIHRVSIYMPEMPFNAYYGIINYVNVNGNSVR